MFVPMLTYWRTALKLAFARSLRATGISAGALALRGTLLLIVICLLLYFGWEQVARDEITLAATSALAAVFVLITILVANIVYAPVLLDREKGAQISRLTIRLDEATYLRSLCDELTETLDKNEKGRPGGERDISFISKPLRGNPGFHASGDSIITTDADDPDVVNLLRLQHEARRKYDREKQAAILEQFGGRIGLAIQIASRHEESNKGVFNQILQKMNTPEYWYYQRAEFDALIQEFRTAAERLKHDHT